MNKLGRKGGSEAITGKSKVHNKMDFRNNFINNMPFSTGDMKFVSIVCFAAECYISLSV